MIIFDKLWETMSKKGMSTYQLREKCGIDSKTIRRLKANENIETKTLDKLCSALECRLEDIAEFEDVANAAWYFGSDESRNTTGTELVVDGGMLAQLTPNIERELWK